MKPDFARVDRGGAERGGVLASSNAIFAGALRREHDHARTTAALTALGYPPPDPAGLAEAAALRADTLRRQADPSVRRTLADVLRRLQ
jgi:hypothetical protein